MLTPICLGKIVSVCLYPPALSVCPPSSKVTFCISRAQITLLLPITKSFRIKLIRHKSVHLYSNYKTKS